MVHAEIEAPAEAGRESCGSSGAREDEGATAVAGRCLWHRFVDGYTRPFHEKYGDSAAGGAGDMLDLIEEGAFVATGSGRLQPVSKAAVFREFMAPLDLEDEIPARDAEAALAFLVEQGMVEVAGDTITVPARFWNGGQVPAT